MPYLPTLKIQIARVVYQFEVDHDAVYVTGQSDGHRLTFSQAETQFLKPVYDPLTQVWQYSTLQNLAAWYTYRTTLDQTHFSHDNQTVGDAIHATLRVMGASFQPLNERVQRRHTATNPSDMQFHLTYDPDDEDMPYSVMLISALGEAEHAIEPSAMQTLCERWLGNVPASEHPASVEPQLSTASENDAPDAHEDDPSETTPLDATHEYNWPVPSRLPIWTVDWEAWRDNTFLRQGSMNIPAENRQEAEQGVHQMLDQLFPNLYPGAEIVFTSVLAEKDA